MSRLDLLGQDFGDVDSFAAGEVFDLLAAGDACDGDDGVVGGGADAGEEAFFADLAGDVVVLTFVAEGSCHAAAARAGFFCVEPGVLEHAHGWDDTDQRFLVAVTVEEDAALAVVAPLDAEVV